MIAHLWSIDAPVRDAYAELLVFSMEAARKVSKECGEGLGVGGRQVPLRMIIP